MTEWNPPGPGPWQQDSAHTPVSQSAIMQEVYPGGFNRGFTETFSRYGMLLDRLAMGVVNGFTYHQPQPFDMPGPDGPKSQEEIEAEFGKRVELAAAVFANQLWKQDLAEWDDEWKPRAIEQHRTLSAVDLASLDDDALVAHLDTVGDHVSQMVYQHHRFNMAAVLPVGDFALHAAEWASMPPPALLGVLDGYSTVSGALPDEMRAAVDAVRGSEEAQQVLRGEGDPGERVARLRQLLPAVDDWLRTVDCRLIDGFDVVNPTIRERPELVLGKLASGLVADPEAPRRRADAFAADVRSRVPAEHHEQFDELLREARANYRLRDERGIYSEMSAIGLLRLALLEAGRRAHERGNLERADDVLDATLAEVPVALAGDSLSGTLAERGRRRRALTAEGPPRHLGPPPPPPPPVDELPPPLARLMSATGFMIDAILGQLDQAAGDDSTIIGLSGNTGSHEGTARLIGQIEDMFDLEEGEILVASATSEAFNSILHMIGGIVTDHGSHACHAAIVAREVGIPAVVGTVDATKRIRTGDRIRVDGSKGEVSILSAS